MITIITSAYKSEKFLPKFIKETNKIHQLLNKKGIIFEHLIISNKPSEKEKFMFNKNLNFKLIFVPLESIYKSWNRGVSESKYQYLTFWNVDDTRNLDAIIDGIKKINHGAKLVYFPFIYKRYIKILNTSILVKKYKVNPPEFKKEIFIKNMHCGPHFMFNKKIIKEVGYFDESFKIVGDFEWCQRAAQKINFDRSNIISGEFRSFGTGLSTKDKNANLRELGIIKNENNNTFAS